MNGYATSREMGGVLAGAAPDVENAVAWLEKRVDLAPYQIALRAANRGSGP